MKKNCVKCGGTGRGIIKANKIAWAISKMGGLQGLPPFIVKVCDNCRGSGTR